VYSVARDCDNGKVDPKVPPHICILLLLCYQVIIISFHETIKIIIALF
jgi:hypothetical protein